jgi:hypothetical protein
LASLDIEIGGTTPGTQFDRVIVADEATLDGTLNVTTINGFAPTLPGQLFTIMTYATHTGEFADLIGQPSPSLPGLFWTVTYGDTRVLLSTSALPGDIDLDGDVDRTDAALFTPHLGTTTSAVWTTGDFNGDHETTLADLALQQANFGATFPSPSAPSAAVPEPSAWMIATSLIATILLAFARRRR